MNAVRNFFTSRAGIIALSAAGIAVGALIAHKRSSYKPPKKKPDQIEETKEEKKEKPIEPEPSPQKEEKIEPREPRSPSNDKVPLPPPPPVEQFTPVPPPPPPAPPAPPEIPSPPAAKEEEIKTAAPSEKSPAKEPPKVMEEAKAPPKEKEDAKEQPYFYDPDFVKENIPLYHTEAITRSKFASDVKYNLFLSMDEGTEFLGQLTVEFILSNLEELKDGDLFLDFHGKATKGIYVNESLVDPNKAFMRHRIFLPRQLLVPGKNTARISFLNTYVTNSAGLHRFQESDNSIYIFSHLEPFFCHRIFPCFDQPDMRAPISLAVHTCNPNWVVVGNGADDKNLSMKSKEA